MIRIGGTYILLGAIYPNNHVTLDSSDIITKCLKIVGMHNYNPEHLKTALELVLKTKDSLTWVLTWIQIFFNLSDITNV